MNEAWLCPRCERINAPFNPTCFCSPDDEIISDKSSDKPSQHLTDAARYLNPEQLYKILEGEKRKAEISIGLMPNFYNVPCSVCNGRHAFGQECATLKNNLPPGGEFI